MQDVCNNNQRFRPWAKLPVAYEDSLPSVLQLSLLLAPGSHTHKYPIAAKPFSLHVARVQRILPSAWKTISPRILGAVKYQIQ